MDYKAFGPPDSAEFGRLREAVMAQRKVRTARLCEEAWGKARMVAELLHNKYGARRVLVFGSLAKNGFRDGSDIDIFAEGCSGSYWRMVSEAERLASPFEVHIVCDEDASSTLVMTVTNEGVEL